MTVEELAQAMGKDIGETQPALGTETATSATSLPPEGKTEMASVAITPLLFALDEFQLFFLLGLVEK